MLGPGSYSVTTALTRGQTHLDENYEWSDNLLVFDVINVDKAVFIGSQYLPGKFEIQKLKAPV